jgi:hypothetical protein
LVWLIALVEEEFESVIDHSEIEEETIAGQAVPSVPSDLDTSFWVIAI